jgi:nucleoside-diphosphate-sugar epimerase
VRVFDLEDDPGRPAGVEFVKGDIRNQDAVISACKNVEVVHHNIAQVPLSKNNELFEQVNSVGTKNMLDAALKAGVKKFVFTSSSAVYGIPKLNPVTEKTTPQPGEAYGRSKLIAEEICAQYTALGLDISIIRPRTIVSPGRLGIMQVLFEWIYQNKTVPVIGNGANTYQFIHATDLASATLLAGQRAGNSVYNIGAEHYGTMYATISNLIKYANSNSKIVSLPLALAEPAMNFADWLKLSPLASYHAMMYGRSMYFDISLAKQELGFKPKYSNDEMFRESYDWYSQNRIELLQNKSGSRHKSVVKPHFLNIVNGSVSLLPPVR